MRRFRLFTITQGDGLVDLMPGSKETDARDGPDLSPIMVLCVHKASQSLAFVKSV